MAESEHYAHTGPGTLTHCHTEVSARLHFGGHPLELKCSSPFVDQSHCTVCQQCSNTNPRSVTSVNRGLEVQPKIINANAELDQGQWAEQSWQMNRIPDTFPPIPIARILLVEQCRGHSSIIDPKGTNWIAWPSFIKSATTKCACSRLCERREHKVLFARQEWEHAWIGWQGDIITFAYEYGTRGFGYGLPTDTNNKNNFPCSWAAEVVVRNQSKCKS